MDLASDIGFVAGEIYFGGIDKPVEISAVKKKVNKRDDIFYMALGWLAREGKVEITLDKGKTYVRKIN
ncbi:MAG: winged helix-turn-helix domain-containing protein [Candidatus Altiarchaeota archaeon]